MAAPEPARPPEVEAVKQRMEGTWSRGALGYHKVTSQPKASSRCLQVPSR